MSEEICLAAAESSAASAESSAASAELAADEAVLADADRVAAAAHRTAVEGVVATNDGLMTTVDGNAASAFRVQQDARLVDKGELVMNATDYGIVGDTTTQDLTALNAAITAAAAFGGVAVYFPRPTGAYYAFNTALPNVNGVRLHGDAKTTILRWVSGNMLAPTGNLQKWTIENIKCQGSSAAGHLIELGATGGLIHSVFRNCELEALNPASTILHADGDPVFFNNLFDEVMCWRTLAHTVPAFDIKTTASAVSLNRWKGGQWHSKLCNSTPFFRIENTGTTGYVSGFTFTDVLGEQNLGGMVHAYGAGRFKIDGLMDYDTTGETYTDDLFKIDTSSSGRTSNFATVERSGTVGTFVGTSGKVVLRITAGTGHFYRAITQSGTNRAPVSVPDTGCVTQNGGAIVNSTRYTTTSPVPIATDHSLIVDGTNRTPTIPDPTALYSGALLPIGREYVIKNANSTTATVTATATVIGTATLTDTGDLVTSSVAHGLIVDDLVKFATVTTTTGIVAGTAYYVKTAPSTTTLTLSATSGGATIDLVGDGSATGLARVPTIDGATSHILEQFEVARYVTDGRNWRIFGMSSPGGPPKRTTANLASITNAINTVGKVQGRMVWNTSTVKPVYASGTTAGAVWVFADGTTAHTPV